MSDWRALVREVVEHRYGDLVAYAYVVAGNRPDAEDLVQEALVATFSAPRTIPDRGMAEAYVRQAIVTRFIDGRRKSTREQRTVGEVALHRKEYSPGADASVDLQTDLSRAMATLSNRERACVALRYLEALSVRETALVLHLAEGSVKRYVSDGLAKLNAQLGTDASAVDAETAPVQATGGAR